MLKYYKFICITLLVFTTLIITGCAKKPAEELTGAEASLRAAEEAGARELAPEEFRAAEELIERAKELMNQGRHKEARELLRQAKIKADEARYKAELAKRDKELERLREEGIPEVAGTGIQDIFFDFDKYNIRPDAIPVLERNAEILRNNPDISVVIEGYCDIRGTEEYNLALGQRRADSTKNYLVRLGISPSRIQAISRGETTKWAEGTTEEAYQLNRRAHFIPTRSLPSM
ncbi:Peptidoglycan-associated lipoprotein [bacterium HR37]|nr:Peptidoglycan-associated lipoprotein [bacterium HR37]